MGYILSMYTIETITPPASEPVLVAELRAHLRINDNSEDAALTMFIKAAREMFERMTGLAVYATTVRQHFQNIVSPIVLVRGPIRSLTNVKFYDPSGTLTTSTTHTSDIISLPGLIKWESLPSVSLTKSPVGFVEYIVGWDSGTIPEQVRLAIKLYAGMLYVQRESHNDANLKEIPLGFKAVADQYRTLLHGTWGQ